MMEIIKPYIVLFNYFLRVSAKSTGFGVLLTFGIPTMPSFSFLFCNVDNMCNMRLSLGVK